MPFASRIVGEFLGDEPQLANVNASVSNVPCQNALLHVFRELDSLVRQADNLLQDLYMECSIIVQRTQKIRNRVTALTEVVHKLNAREVLVPESNLSHIAQIGDHYQSHYGYDCQLFHPSTRPECVQRLHQSADVSPLHLIRKCETFRTDGKYGSRIFSRPPVITADDLNCSSLEIFQPIRIPVVHRTLKALREPKRTHLQNSGSLTNTASAFDADDSNSLPATQSTRLRRLCHSQPVLIVPVDVSGTTYNQVSERRKSNQALADGSFETQLKPGKCRSSASVGQIDMAFGFQLLTCDDLWKRSPSKERWDRVRCLIKDPDSTASKGKKIPKPLKNKNKAKKDAESKLCSWTKSLCLLFKSSKLIDSDLWIESRPETKCRKQFGRAVENMPFLRSQSLPRSFRTSVHYSRKSAITSQSLSSIHDADFAEDMLKSVECPSGYQSLPRLHSARKRCSKISINSSENLTQMSVSSITGSRSTSVKHLSQPILPVTTTLSNLVSHAVSTSSREVIVHLPEQPWTKPFATVKLRPQIAKAEADGHQTHSGNWSADSACHSMHSDQVTTVLPSSENLTRHSLDKDSAISVLNHCADRYSMVQCSTNNNLKSASSELSLVPSTPRIIRRAASSFGCSANGLSHDFWALDDQTSLYSVDQDGFYTSMHADSGVLKSNHTLVPKNEVEELSDLTDNVTSTTSWKEPIRSCDTDGDALLVVTPNNQHVSISHGNDSKMTVEDVSVESFKEPDSEDHSGIKEEVVDWIPVEDSLLVPEMDAFIESQSEVLQTKTKTRSSGFPSFCSITPSSSDAEDLHASSEHDSKDSMTALKVEYETNSSLPSSLQPEIIFSLSSSDSGRHHFPPAEQTADIQTASEYDSAGSYSWPVSSPPTSHHNIKGILKTKKDLFTPECIKFSSPTYSQENMSTEGNMGSSSVGFKDFTSSDSYSTPGFSSFLGEKVNRYKTKDARHTDTENPGTEDDGVLPSRYMPVIVVKPKTRNRDSVVSQDKIDDTKVAASGYRSSNSWSISKSAESTSQPCGGTNIELNPVNAKLVITSPVMGRSMYIDNPHKRSLCTALSPQDLVQYSGYNSPESWYNTLPRNVTARKKTSKKMLEARSPLSYCGNLCNSGLEYPSNSLTVNKARTPKKSNDILSLKGVSANSTPIDETRETLGMKLQNKDFFIETKISASKSGGSKSKVGSKVGKKIMPSLPDFLKSFSPSSPVDCKIKKSLFSIRDKTVKNVSSFGCQVSATKPNSSPGIKYQDELQVPSASEFPQNLDSHISEVVEGGSKDDTISELTKSNDSISLLISASEPDKYERLAFHSPDSEINPNCAVSSQRHNPVLMYAFSNRSLRSADQRSSANGQSLEFQKIGRQRRSDFEPPMQETLAPVAAVGHGSVFPFISYLQKQSFESDTSGVGSSVSGSPMTSPDTEVTVCQPLPPSHSSGLQKLLPSFYYCVSPDVIPLTARNGFDSRTEPNSMMKGKQTTV